MVLDQMKNIKVQKHRMLISTLRGLPVRSASDCFSKVVILCLKRIRKNLQQRKLTILIIVFSLGTNEQDVKVVS